MEEYLEMVSYLRTGADPSAYQEWMAQFLEPLGGQYDAYGNYIVTEGEPNGILFSAHTDTVSKTTSDIRIDSVHVMRANSRWMVKTDGSRPLGADDTNGVWILREMIRHHYPATYIFHRDEEMGGLGSHYIAQNHQDWLSQFQVAIAIDRKGYQDVITHMVGTRTCSDTFAMSLANHLGMQLCTKGGITDTYNYVGLIPNCTNLSCGYFRAHTNHEYADFTFCQELLNKLLQLEPKLLQCSAK